MRVQKAQKVQLVAYDQVEVHTDMKAAVLVGDDVCIHSYALGHETLVHIWKVRILEQHMD